MSSLEAGVDPKWGLSELGTQQADAAGEELLNLLGTFDPSDLLICTSPFSRTLETAARVASHLDVHLHDPRFMRVTDLRERFFGAHELGNAGAYEIVWANDAVGTHIQPPSDGESVDSVVARLRAFVNQIEGSRSGHNIVVVSHGDALSIMAAMLLGEDLGQHRQFGLSNCGILKVPLTTS